MASKSVGLLTFTFGANMKGFNRAMTKAQKKLKKFGRSMVKTGKSLTMGLTLPLIALGKVSIDAFDAQQKAIAQVEAGLKSTAHQVGITSEKLQKMAADLQKKTLFGDEEILKDATAQLLTFTNITGTQFARTQEIALDLATRLDGDLKSASIMLGKALNDPVANLSALSRAGIQFSTEQKSTIKALVETNQLADAQTIILEELEKQYGGSAEAAALAGSGPIKQLQNELSDLSEQIGERLIPYIKDFVKWIKGLALKFDGLSSKQKDNIVKWGLILAAVGPVLIIIGKLSLGIGALIPAFTKLGALIMAQPWIALAAALLIVGTAAYSVVKSLTAQFDAQQALNDVTKEAGSRMAEEVASIETLVYAINTETTSLEEKTTALNTLKKLYPGYYDEVDEATFSQDAMALSTANLKAALLEMAMLDVYADKLKKVTAEIIELEQSITAGDINTSTRILTGSTVGVLTLGSGFGAVAVAAADYFKVFNQPIQDISNVTQLEKLKKTQAFYLEGQLELEKKTKDYNLLIPKVTHGVSNLGKKTDKVTDSTKELTKELSSAFKLFGAPKLEALEHFWIALSNIQKQNLIDGVITQKEFDKQMQKDKIEHLEGIKKIYEEFGEDTLKIDAQILDAKLGFYKEEIDAVKKLTDAQKLMNAGIELFGDILTSSLNSALDSQENFFKAFIKNIKRAIRSLLIELAVMTLINALMGGGKAAFSLGAIKGNLMKIMNIPQAAEGGLVTGPTTALIGEAGPEVIIPLDRVQSMLGGGEQHITVTGKLIGNDIFLSNAKTGVNRLRTV